MKKWKDISTHKGLYKISLFGQVYDLQNHKIVKPINTKKNNVYRTVHLRHLRFFALNKTLRVFLFNEEKSTTHTIHRLVAQHFIPNPENYRFVNHKNDNKNDNNIKNLEWCYIHPGETKTIDDMLKSYTHPAK